MTCDAILTGPECWEVVEPGMTHLITVFVALIPVAIVATLWDWWYDE